MVYESSDRAGGVLQTVREDDFLIERSADNFLTKEPWGVDFCKRLGIADQLLPTEEKRRRALVVHNGKVVPAPEGFVLMQPRKLISIFRSPILSWRGKLRVACEPLLAREVSDEDESVASFARRRLGVECFERLVQPLLGGIYTADPEKLSMAATMPQFVEHVRHGSLYRAARQEAAATRAGGASESGARYGLFLAPRLGMKQLVDAAVRQLPVGSFKQRRSVRSVKREAGGWRLGGKGGDSLGKFNAVIVTTPAHLAAPMLTSTSAELAKQLSGIPYAGCTVVCLGFRRAQIAADVPGFGFVVPAIENRRLIAASFASFKFPGRAPDDGVLVRAFIGGALQPELAELPDQALRKVVLTELGDLVGLTGEPLVMEIARWPRGMPQYHVGHLDRVERIETLTEQLPGLELAGAAYRGVGIPQCIHSGEHAADRVVALLRRAT